MIAFGERSLWKYILAVRKDNVRNLGFAEFKRREMEYGAKNVEKRKCVGKPNLLHLKKKLSKFKVRCHEKGRIKTISFWF